MIRPFWLFLLIFFSLESCKTFSKINRPNKAFEGSITYSIQVTDKNSLSLGYDKGKIGTEIEIFFKKDKYLSVINSTPILKEYYLGEDTLYTFSDSSTFIGKENSKFYSDIIISYKLLHNKIKVAKKTCQLFHIETTKGYINYYFNDDYRLDYADYASFNNGLWNLCLKETGAIALKKITCRNNICIELTAINIQERKLPNKLFLLPSNEMN